MANVLPCGKTISKFSTFLLAIEIIQKVIEYAHSRDLTAIVLSRLSILDEYIPREMAVFSFLPFFSSIKIRDAIAREVCADSRYED